MTAPAEAPATPDAAAPEATDEGATFSADYVRTLRDEAAQARIKANEKVAAAKAVLTDQHATALAELAAAKDAELEEARTGLSAAQTQLLKMVKAIEAGVSSDSILDIVDLVQGNDEATISASVAKVTALLSKPPTQVSAVDKTQGTGGQAIPLNGDPVLKALKAAVGMK